LSDSLAYIGVATPQANPTVEIEFQRFMRGHAHALFTRLTSRADASGDRLVEYIEQMPTALSSFDTLPLKAFAFACTGSAYLLGDEREEQITNGLMQRHQIPIVTATQAIRRELEGRGATRIAMLTPYPEDICDAAIAYWKRLGFNVIALKRIDIGTDTRAIYELTDERVAAALADFDDAGADLVLLSGTGMPTIAALQHSNAPMLSSNLCLATEVLRRVHVWPPGVAADINALCSNDS
jgi:maleate isomerase